MPCRAANKTSATAITATTSVVDTKVVVAMSIKKSKSWWSDGVVIVVGVTLSIVLLLLVSALIVGACTTSTTTASARSDAPKNRLPHKCLGRCREFLHSLNTVVYYLFNWNNFACPRKVVTKEGVCHYPMVHLLNVKQMWRLMNGVDPHL